MLYEFYALIVFYGNYNFIKFNEFINIFKFKILKFIIYYRHLVLEMLFWWLMIKRMLTFKLIRKIIK